MDQSPLNHPAEYFYVNFHWWSQNLDKAKVWIRMHQCDSPVFGPSRCSYFAPTIRLARYI